MDKVAMALLKQEEIRAKNQFFASNRKIIGIKRFRHDFPDAEIEKVQTFLSFIDHTDLSYKEILERMGDK